MIKKKIRETFFTAIVSGLVGIMVTNSAYANSQYPNTATMSYKKPDNTKIKITSNTVVTVKEETPGIDLRPLFTSAVSTPCGTWVFPITVTNTGTYNTTFSLSLVGLPPQMSYTLYENPNQDIYIQPTENPITKTTLLHPGKSYYFNIKIVDTGCSKYDTTYPVEVHAVSDLDPNIKSFKPLAVTIGTHSSPLVTQPSSSPTPTPTPSATPTPVPGLKASLKKSVFPVGGVVPNDTLSYYLEFTNENTFNATDTVITDKLPEQVDLLKEAGAEPVASSNGKVEYSQEGTVWTETTGNNPRYIRFKYPLVTSFQTVTALFKVKVRDDVQSGVIDNMARAQYLNPNGSSSIINSLLSNVVSNPIKNIYSIIGTVYDQITGLPVEGVTVDVYDKNGNKVGTDITGKLGKYNVPVPTKGEYKVVYIGSNGEIINQKRSLVEKIGANPSPIELAGKVTDSQTKEIYPDTKLQLLDSDGNVIYDTVTDKNGKFIIDADKNGNDLKPGTYMIKIIAKDGKIVYGRVTVSVVAGDVILNLEILIDPFGIVYDKLGGKDVRIKDSKVILYSGDCSQKSSIVKLDELEKGVSQTNPYLTDERGTYQYFLNKDQLTNKTYCLDVSKDGYKEENYLLVTNPSKTEVGRYTLTVIDSKGNKKFLSNIASIPHEVPLEPLRVFDIVKTANKSTIEIGDIVTYKIEATNKLKFKVKDAFIEDNIPHGFRYVDGTMLVDNQKLPNFKPTTPEKLRVPVGDLNPEQKVTIAYQLRTGIKVDEGPAINVADIIGKAPNGTDIISDQVKATVFVKKGIFSKNGAVLGRVYVDSDDNGVYDGKDNGIENVNIYTANGLRITTDLKGKYSVPDLPNGDFLLSIDKTTLPKNLYLPEDAIKIAKERKAQLEKATTSEIDINKGNTFNVIQGKDLVLTNTSGMKAVLTIKDGKELIVRNSSNVYASSDIIITQDVDKSGKLFKQSELLLAKGLNTIPVKFIDTDGKQVKTKQLNINVIPDVKIPNDEVWIGDEGNSKRVFITESGFSKANFRLVRLDPFELNVKTSSPENVAHSLKAVYVYPEQFSVKEIPYITYPDIQNHWSREIVEYESGLEIIHGYPDGNFKPSRSISRAEATKLTLVALKSFDVKIGTSLGYIIDTDSKVTARILDKDGNVVKEFFVDADKKAGINLIYWNGKNNNGKISNVGEYTFEVVSTSKNGNTNKLATALEVIPAIPNYHPNGKSTFPDVPDWFWATAFIKVANEENLVKGYDNGNFLPDKFIPRYEMATIAVKALGLDLSLGKEILKFKDSEEVPVWARKAVYLADMYGILPAYPNGKYYPYRNTSRAEIANVVLELINRQKLDVKVGGTIVEDLSSVNVEGKKVELLKEKNFSIPLKKEYKDDVDVTVPEIENFKVMIDELYKNKGVKRDLFDSFVK